MHACVIYNSRQIGVILALKGILSMTDASGKMSVEKVMNLDSDNYY